MRYLVLTYYRKANGKIDEGMAVTKNLKKADWQISNVILDFKELKVLKCSIDGTEGVRDWETVVAYYYPHYTHIIERLFEENGHSIEVTAPAEDAKSAE